MRPALGGPASDGGSGLPGCRRCQAHAESRMARKGRDVCGSLFVLWLGDELARKRWAGKEAEECGPGIRLISSVDRSLV